MIYLAVHRYAVVALSLCETVEVRRSVAIGYVGYSTWLLKKDH